MVGSHRTHPPIKKTNERFPPKGTPIKSFFSWFSLLPAWIICFLFSGFSFGKNYAKRSGADHNGSGKREKRVSI